MSSKRVRWGMDVAFFLGGGWWVVFGPGRRNTFSLETPPSPKKKPLKETIGALKLCAWSRHGPSSWQNASPSGQGRTPPRTWCRPTPWSRCPTQCAPAHSLPQRTVYPCTGMVASENRSDDWSRKHRYPTQFSSRTIFVVLYIHFF
jgi:hypothetical protein